MVKIQSGTDCHDAFPNKLVAPERERAETKGSGAGAVLNILNRRILVQMLVHPERGRILPLCIWCSHYRLLDIFPEQVVVQIFLCIN